VLKGYFLVDSEDPEDAPEPTELWEVSKDTPEPSEPTESESEALKIQAVL